MFQPTQVFHISDIKRTRIHFVKDFLYDYGGGVVVKNYDKKLIPLVVKAPPPPQFLFLRLPKRLGGKGLIT